MALYRDGARRYCAWLTRAAKSNFALGLKLLPKERYEAMQAVYAFCRAVDDVVDREEAAPGPESVAAARRELELWRGEIRACVEGYPTHPIAVALQPVIRGYRIPPSYFNDLIDGCGMDLTRRRYATFEELRVYCEHVASVVGLISIRVFGCEHPASESYAVNLGIALQLTNILRDLKTDRTRGRVYLPEQELKRFGCSDADLAHDFSSSEPFSRMMAFQCARAREFFHEARRALEASGEYAKLVPAQIMGAVYAQLLSRIEAARYDVFSTRVAVPRGRQVLAALRIVLTQGRWNYA